ncbi:uncharacterized protein EV420DRAFT_1483408 [Desarmillaria tabescens]|uniref:C2H2-type domain-containing protein n=1 Tax=Armillaria tabescens TaxID=1929756 RepID=A0AA39MVA9_ARMTA|nr:uncharacterized protein EV420DRAFT_1483408 [Desarmillaria tabescens]KAK0448396.1 hypothetical protein EV420DRAFT_1483408 [Desarmillaria tabescens]
MADNANVTLPDHMLRVSPEIRVKGSAPPTLIPSHPYVPPQPLRKPSSQDTRSHPGAPVSLPHLLPSDSDEDESKKHICTVCKKRFRRPSSLNIHINTHTGATLEGQDQARGQVQSYPPRSWHDGTQTERERYYQRHYSMCDARLPRGGDERDNEMDASRSYSRHD